MLRVNRQDILKTLEMLQPGLSSKGILDQSDCYVFTQDGSTTTFNTEVACRSERGLPGIVGAVKAGPMLAQVQKWPEEELEFEVEATDKSSVLWMYGTKRKAWFNLQAEITLPVESIEKPGEWRPLPPHFGDAVALVQTCAGKDINKFQSLCVHIHPKWVEATDNVQVSRYTLEEIPELEKTLVRASSIRSMPGLGMTHWSQGKAWMHFKNGHGLTYSCQRFLEDFPDVGEALRVEGEKTQFPKSIQKTIDKAEVFSRERGDDSQVTVSLLQGKLRIQGVGASGGFSEVKEVLYSGKPMSFLIAPKMLAEIVKEHSEIYVSEDKLVVDGGAWVWRTCIGTVEE